MKMDSSIYLYMYKPDVLKILLAAGTNLDSRDDNGDTALMHVSRNGYKDAIDLLIDSGADTETENFRKRTILTCVTERYETYSNSLILMTLEYLINKGIDVDMRNSNKKTALIDASARGYVDVIRYLIKKGANLEAKDNYGYTALHCALTSGYKEVVHLLVEAGANLETKDNTGRTALRIALGCNHRFSAELQDLKNRYERYKILLWGTTTESIEYLLSKGADVTARDNNGETVLACTLGRNREAMTKLLRQAGAKE